MNHFLFGIFFVVALSGCVSTSTDGGKSFQSEAGQVMEQPENPEGYSEQIETIKETVDEFGILKREVERKTRLNGSQDLATILDSAGGIEGIRNALLAALMGLGAWFAWKRGQHALIASMLACGAISTFLFSYWVTLAFAAVSGALYIGYRIAKPQL